MIYTLIIILMLIALVWVVVYTIGSMRVGSSELWYRNKNTELRHENLEMRLLLNRIARDDVGNPALEAQLKLEEIDRKHLG